MSTINEIVEERREEIEDQYRAAVQRLGEDQFTIWLLDSDDRQGAAICRAFLKAQRASVGHFSAWKAGCRAANSLAVMIAAIENRKTAAMLLLLDRKAAKLVTQHRHSGAEFFVVLVSKGGVTVGTLPRPMIEVPVVDPEYVV